MKEAIFLNSCPGNFLLFIHNHANFPNLSPLFQGTNREPHLVIQVLGTYALITAQLRNIMKLKTILLLVLSVLHINCFKSAERPQKVRSSMSIYNLSYTSINGKEVRLDAYKGKKLLIVNVASKCGFTPQYEGLEKLYETYKDKLTIVGFPANNFHSQEPGSNEEISEFCKLNYGVSFPLAQKISVVGEDKDPIYKWLTDKSLNGWNELEPQWNFYKYLIDENGELIKVFASQTKPLDEEIISYLK